MTIRTLLVDDEALARRGLALRLADRNDIDIVAQCENGRQALNKIAELSPDLVFLDIQMPGMSGFDMVRNLQADNTPLIVFVTAYDQYAIDAFDVHAVDYLLKPIDAERLNTAIERVKSRLSRESDISEKQRLIELIGSITGESFESLEQIMDRPGTETTYPQKIAIKDRGETLLLDSDTIDWIEAAGDYMCVHVKQKVHVMRSTMKELEGLLNPQSFQRVHRSTIVNLDQVEKICTHINGEYFLHLKSGEQVKMSRTYRDKLKYFDFQ